MDFNLDEIPLPAAPGAELVQLEPEDVPMIDDEVEEPRHLEELVPMDTTRIQVNELQLKKYVDDHAKRDELQSLFRDRLLVVGLPKRDLVEEIDQLSFEERYEKFLFEKQAITYTMTFKYSQFLKKIVRDPAFRLHYDFFAKDIAEKVGSQNEQEWVAEFSLCCIMHTHMHNDGPRFEFFFQLDETSIITRNIIVYYEKIKQRVIEKLPKLKNDPLFCLTECNNDCFQSNDSYHYSLIDMKSLEVPEDQHQFSRVHGWTFLDNEDQLEKHPLKMLLLPPEMNDGEEIVCALTRVLNNFQLNETRRWYTYILLVVKEFAMVPNLDNLKEIWESKTATFGIYVGCTCQGKFRTDHLKTEDEGGKSAVSKFIDVVSSVFLVTSIPFVKKTDALNAEARIIGFLMYEKRMVKRNRKNLQYEVLNVNKENVPMRQNTPEDSNAYKAFMLSGQKLFRFRGEEVSPDWITIGVLQTYLVDEQIK